LFSHSLATELTGKQCLVVCRLVPLLRRHVFDVFTLPYIDVWALTCL
jgi:hypothetical protein